MTFEVQEGELYDGPVPGQPAAAPRPAAPPPNVHALPPRPPQRPVQVAPAINPQFIALINSGLNVLATRLLALLAVIGAVAMFGYAVYDPMQWRTYTVVAYAAVVLWPLVYLHLKQGLQLRG